MVILGVLINETCYKTRRVSTRDFTVYNALSKEGKNGKFSGVQLSEKKLRISQWGENVSGGALS